MLQEDIFLHGQITPETRRQVRDEELTYVAEAINRPMRTDFELTWDGDDLIDEKGRPLSQTLTNGIKAAENAAWGDSRLWFRVKRAVSSFEEGNVLRRMMNGETQATTVVSFSPFPEEAFVEHGQKFIEDAGYNAERKLGFIYVYTKTASDKLSVTSLTIDNSDLEVFRAVAGELGLDISETATSDDIAGLRHIGNFDSIWQENLPEYLTGRYDINMGRRYGQSFKAGRPKTDEVDAWQFINSQSDLVEYYFNQLEQMAATLISPDELVDAKTNLTYSFWAALSARLKSSPRGREQTAFSPVELRQEMNLALQAAVANQERMIGCGGAIAAAQKGLLDLQPDQAVNSIFGEKKETYIWKSGICRVDNCPSRPRSTKVGPCSVCVNCQHLFDRGIDPAVKYRKHAKTT